MKNESLSNELIELKHRNSLYAMENDIIGNRLIILTDSIKNLSNSKGNEESLMLIISTLQQQILDLIKERDMLKVDLNSLITDKSTLEQQLKDMNVARLKALKEKDEFLRESKIKINTLEKDLSDTKLELDKWKDKLEETEKNLAISNKEKDQLRERIVDIKKRKDFNTATRIWK